MAIDDFPPDALTAQLSAEERSTAGIDGIVKQVAEFVPGFVGNALGTFVRRDSEHKRCVLLEVLRDVLKTHDDKIRRLWEQSEAYQRFIQTDWPALLIDAVKKVERTRAEERVRRIALILGNAALLDNPPAADDVEECMRIAMDLTDIDVVVLREFVNIEGSSIAFERGRMDRYQAHQAWDRGAWRNLGISEGELQSVCSKLESFGLVSRLAPPNNLNILADFQNRYALLQRGQRFVEFIERARLQSHDPSTSHS